jgi:hypothetical protein
MDCMIDPTNGYIYLTVQNALKRGSLPGINPPQWLSITPPGASPNFDIHLDMDATNTDRIYYGDGTGIYRSGDRGANWTQIYTSIPGDGRNRMIKIGVDDPSVLYAAVAAKIFVSINATSAIPTWLDITNLSGSGLSGVNITDIAVNPANSAEVAVCMAGFNNGNKVFISNDGGNNWTNISGSLPNIPMQCIEWVPGSNNGLYVGADVGVYYRDDDISEWIPHRNGLPHTPVFDLEILSSHGKIRVGTYGRGMWESSLYSPCAADYFLTNVNLPGSGSQGYRYYKASNDINSSREIDGGLGTNVTYQADHMVALTTGFVASEHSLFRAFNAPCDYLPPGFSVGQEITGTYAGPMEGVLQSTVGLEDLDGEQEYLLVYPNPTNGLVNIEFKLKEATDVSLLITDLSGRFVANVIPTRELSIGSYKVSHDLTSLSAGLYLCSLVRGETISTARIAITDL